MNILIGQLEDNVLLLTYHYLLREFGVSALSWINFPYGANLAFSHTSQPLMWGSFTRLSMYFSEILVYNGFLLLGLLLTIFTTHKLFFLFTKNKLSAQLGAVLFVCSPYFYYQSRSHIDLIQYWSVILFVTSVLNAKTLLNYVVAGVIAGIAVLTSTYLGFICILFLALHFTLRQLVSLFFKLSFWTMRTLVGHIILGLFLGTLILPVALPFLNPPEIRNTVQDTLSDKTIPERPLEDFVDFSAKPWFYVLPPTDHLFLGGLSMYVQSFLKDTWGYFWLNNYFKSEHSTSYLGIVNILVASWFMYKLAKSRKFNIPEFEQVTKIKLVTLLAIGVVIFVLSLPPIFTFNGSTLPLPSYIIFKYLSMFRVLARISTIVVLIMCLLVSVAYSQLIRGGYKGLVFLLFALSMFDFFIPLKLVNFTAPPKVYTYIDQNLPPTAVIAVYPYSDLTSALFWMREFKRPLVNTKNFEAPSTGFESEKFTEDLINCSGLSYAKQLGVTHIVFWGDHIYESPEVVFDAEVRTAPKTLSRILIINNGIPEKRSALYAIDILFESFKCGRTN